WKPARRRSSRAPRRPRSATRSPSGRLMLAPRPSGLDATTSAHQADILEVLRRPRHAPRRDDRLLRAPLLRAPPVPLALAARVLGPCGRVELLRHRAEEDLPEPLRRQ